jgi:hypothetical protein
MPATPDRRVRDLVTPDSVVTVEKYSRTQSVDGVVTAEEDGYLVLLDGEEVARFPDHGALGPDYGRIASEYAKCLRCVRYERGLFTVALTAARIAHPQTE